MTDNDTDDLRYRRIDAVAYRDCSLHVRFANGDEVDIDSSLVGPRASTAPDWDRLTSDGVEIEVPTTAGSHYIFWETVRELTDPRYADRLKQADAEYRVRAGQRLRELRKSRGLTGRDVAARAGINNQSLSRIEHGRRGVTLTTLRRILNAMGCTLQDMVVEPFASEETESARTVAVS